MPTPGGAAQSRKTEAGSGYWMAIRALAFKWIRIMHACWKNKTPYDEARYLKCLGLQLRPAA